jgi:hypothetical protein
MHVHAGRMPQGVLCISCRPFTESDMHAHAQMEQRRRAGAPASKQAARFLRSKLHLVDLAGAHPCPLLTLPGGCAGHLTLHCPCVPLLACMRAARQQRALHRPPLNWGPEEL